MKGGESSLYPPVRDFLQRLGYEVRGEVLDCDVVGVSGSGTVAVELKSTFCLKLVLQAVERISLADSVYVAVPSDSPSLRVPQVRKLLRMLGIGLLSVDMRSGSVDPLLDPGEYRPRPSKAGRARLRAEHMALEGDPNTGGSPKRGGRMTAYRRRALAVAAFLAVNGPSRAAEAASCLGDPGAWSIVYRNVYGWFGKTGPGTYGLTPKGAAESAAWSAGGAIGVSDVPPE